MSAAEILEPWIRKTSKRALALRALGAGPLTTGEVARAARFTSQQAAFAELARLQAMGLVQRSKSGRKGSGAGVQRRWRLRPGGAV